MSIEFTPDFWTPQKLTEKEINEACGFLMNYQKAAVTAASLAEEALPPPTSEGLLLNTVIHYLQSLVRHLGALQQAKVPDYKLFDQEACQKVLQTANATLSSSDDSIWTLDWPDGDGKVVLLTKSCKLRAEQQAALYIYLRSYGLPETQANELASGYYL